MTTRVLLSKLTMASMNLNLPADARRLASEHANRLRARKPLATDIQRAREFYSEWLE